MQFLIGYPIATRRSADSPDSIIYNSPRKGKASTFTLCCHLTANDAPLFHPGLAV